ISVMTEREPSLRPADMGAIAQTLASLEHDLRAWHDDEDTESFPPGTANPLRAMWDWLEPNLQDAFCLAYNKKRRQGSNRISTRDLFQALLRITDDSLHSLLRSLPQGALPEPIDPSIPKDAILLKEDPLLSDCVADSLTQFSRLKPLPRKIG